MALGSAIIGSLRAILSLDTTDFESAAGRVSDVAKGFTRDFKTVGQQATALGSSLTKALTVPIAGLGLGVAKLAIDFESSFAGIGKTVDGVTDQSGKLTEFGKTIAQSFRDMAKEIPVNVNELNNIGAAAGALGIRKEDIVSFTKVMAELGVTTNLTSDQAATAIAQLQNIFNAAGKDTDRFASSLVALGNDGASTESQIVDFAQRIAGAGHQVGLSQQAVLGFSAAMANVGLNAELGGTALSKVISKISVAVDTGSKTLGEFAKTAGMASDEFAKLFKADAEEALKRYIVGLGKAGDTGQNLTVILQDMGLKGSNVQDVMKRLAGAGDQVTHSLNVSKTAWEQNTALTDEATKRFATTEAQLTLLWNRIKDVGITIGNAMLPAIKSLVGIVGELLPVIDTLAHAFAAMPPGIQLTVLGIGAAAAATGPLLYVFGQLATAAGTLTQAFTANGIAMKLLTGNAGSLSSGLGILKGAVAGVAVAWAGWEIGKWLEQFKAARDIVATIIPPMALVYAKQAQLNDQQATLISGIKAETIARAEQKGILLQAADAEGRYREAAQALSNLETVRLGQTALTIEQKKQAIEAELKLGKITQEQANVQLAALGIEQQAAEVRKNRITFADAAALAEKKVNDELAASGVTLAQATAELKKSSSGFEAWASAVHLSAETVSYIKAQVKEHTANLRDNAKAVAEAEKAEKAHEAQLKRTEASLHALGITTKDMVNRSIGELQEHLSDAVADGVDFNVALAAMLPKLLELQKQAKNSGIQIKALDDGIADIQRTIAATAPSFSHLVIAFQPGQMIGGIKMISESTLEAGYQANRTRDAFRAFGLELPIDLAAAASAARLHYADLVASGLATRDQLKKAWQEVIDAEIAAGQRSVGIWQSEILPAIKTAVQSISDSAAKGLTDILTGAQSLAGGLGEIWNGIKSAFFNLVDQMISYWINKLVVQAIGSWASAMAGLGGPAGGFGGSGLVGSLVGGGVSAGVGGAGTGIGLSAPAGAAGSSAGIAAGLGTAAAVGGGVAAVLLIGAALNDTGVFGQRSTGTGYEQLNPNDPYSYQNSDLSAAEVANRLANQGSSGLTFGDETGGPMDWRWDVPNMATGGIVMPKAGGTLLNVGEAGRPEAIVPLDRIDTSQDAPTMRPLILQVDGRTLGRVMFNPLAQEARRLQVATR